MQRRVLLPRVDPNVISTLNGAGQVDSVAEEFIREQPALVAWGMQQRDSDIVISAMVFGYKALKMQLEKGE